MLKREDFFLQNIEKNNKLRNKKSFQASLLIFQNNLARLLTNVFLKTESVVLSSIHIYNVNYRVHILHIS